MLEENKLFLTTIGTRVGGGYNPSKDRCIILRGGGKNAKHFEYNQIYNYKLFDSDYAGDDSCLKYYDKEIKSFRASYMQAYPSSAFALAKNYIKEGLNPPHFEVIFLGSENVLKSQIELINKVFTPKEILYHYGHSEEALLGIKNINDTGYGFLPIYGYCEILDSNGESVNIHETGELTGTSWSRSMPFIRYRTNDYAIRGVPNSENTFNVETIEGRQQEYVIRRDNIKVSIVSICSEHMPGMSQAKEMQFEQYIPGELIVNCVFYDRSNKEQIKKDIKCDLERKFEDKVNCVVKEVDQINKTNNGKNIMLIQHVK